MTSLKLSRLLSYPVVRGVKERIRPGLRRLGVDVIAFDPSISAIARRMRLLQHHQINVVFDIGANEGQYAATLREAGFEGLIVSFEPLGDAFVRLQLRSSRDPHWKCLNLAVADTSGRLRFNVDGSDGQCSSFLNMLPGFAKALGPANRHQSMKEVDAITLDDA